MFNFKISIINFRYAAPIYVNMKEEIIYADPKDPKNAGKTSLNEMFNESDLRTDLDENSYDKVFIGKVTI
jgi:hypothetical protein